MRRVSIDDDDEEGNLKMAVASTNIRKKMMYSRKVFAVLTAVFLVFTIGNMTLFITPGVREFVQQYPILLFLCVPLPLISRLLIAFVDRLNRRLLVLIAFCLHLLSIFLSLTSISLSYESELVYFSSFVIFMNMIILALYTFQFVSMFSTSKMFLFILATSSANSFFLQVLLSIFGFPFFEVVFLSVTVSMYIHFNISYFMSSLSSSDWPLAVWTVFTRIPFL